LKIEKKSKRKFTHSFAEMRDGNTEVTEIGTERAQR